MCKSCCIGGQGSDFLRCIAQVQRGPWSQNSMCRPCSSPGTKPREPRPGVHRPTAAWPGAASPARPAAGPCPGRSGRRWRGVPRRGPRIGRPGRLAVRRGIKSPRGTLTMGSPQGGGGRPRSLNTLGPPAHAQSHMHTHDRTRTQPDALPPSQGGLGRLLNIPKRGVLGGISLDGQSTGVVPPPSCACRGGGGGYGETPPLQAASSSAALFADRMQMKPAKPLLNKQWTTLVAAGLLTGRGGGGQCVNAGTLPTRGTPMNNRQ